MRITLIGRFHTRSDPFRWANEYLAKFISIDEDEALNQASINGKSDMVRIVMLFVLFGLLSPSLLAQTKNEIYYLNLSSENDLERKEVEQSQINLYWRYKLFFELEGNTLDSKKRGKLLATLMPLLKLVDQAERAEGEKKEKLDAQIKEIEEGDELSDQMIDAIGVEMAIKIVQRDNRNRLKNEGKSDWTDPALVLPLGKALELSDEQIDAIMSLRKPFEEVTSEINNSIPKRLSRFRVERFELIKKELEQNQLDRMIELMGTPIEWESIEDHEEILGGSRKRVSSKFYEMLEPTDDMFAERDKLVKLPIEEIKKKGLVPISGNVWTLIAQEEIQAMLQLDSQQGTTIRNDIIFENWSKQGISDPKFETEDVSNLLSGTFEIPAELAEVFSEKQKSRFLQMIFQFATRRQLTSFGLADRRVSKHLGLTPAQVQNISKIANEFRRKKRGIRKQVAADVAHELEKTRRQIHALLTPQQKSTYQKVTGINPNEN